MTKRRCTDWDIKTSQEVAWRSNESVDSALPDNNDDAGIGHVHMLEEEHERSKGRSTAKRPCRLPRTSSPTQPNRGRQEHITGSARRRERSHERHYGHRSLAERMVEVHERRQVHRDPESSNSTAASTAGSINTSRSEQEHENGYESSPSDYSDIWNDYHSPTTSDSGRQETEYEDEEAKKTYDRLCAKPPRAPSPYRDLPVFGEGSSWNAHASNLLRDFDDERLESVQDGRNMISAFESKDPRPRQ